MKNGDKLHNLAEGDSKVHSTSIVVSGEDVYVSGTESFSRTSNSIARLWKNGKEIEIFNPTLTI